MIVNGLLGIVLLLIDYHHYRHHIIWICGPTMVVLGIVVTGMAGGNEVLYEVV